ncbi:hypothetical protein TL16_g12249 [Triparma laevis f. inornata]|uniref:guanylate kinase n=1 Tax=Triparma laevis f. inornata TaxID=1714386 RepID=A0A9W7EW80_9STRA|nr:hypothetical protein TL16_g12249 [Triparma laevis f. inornata]
MNCETLENLSTITHNAVLAVAVFTYAVPRCLIYALAKSRFLHTETAIEEVKRLRALLATYTASLSSSSSSSSSSPPFSPLPLVVCGPSGVGKGTLIASLLSKFPSKFRFSVSHTTRSPREREENTVHYNFVSVEEFEKIKENDDFLEHATVHGNMYGTALSEVNSKTGDGSVLLLDIDVQGVKNVKSTIESKKLSGAKFIFITPKDLTSLEERLRARGTEEEEAIKRRTENAGKEIEYGKGRGILIRCWLMMIWGKAEKEFCEVVKGWYGL